MTALRLAAAMLSLQASIGAVNDLIDVGFDEVGKPAKPIPAGDVPVAVARGWAAFTGALGLVLVVPSGAAAVAIAVVGVSLGYAYDVRLSRTRWSWLTWAAALPLVPIFAWMATRGEVPSSLLALAAVAFPAGAALQLANGLVDVERDRRAGRETVEVAAGRSAAWIANVAALSGAVGLTFLLAPAVRSGAVPTMDAGGWLALARVAGVPGGAFAIAIGAGLLTGRRADLRERGWELEALGTAAMGLGWLAGIAASAGSTGAS